jgi:hypothetical protein
MISQMLQWLDYEDDNRGIAVCSRHWQEVSVIFMLFRVGLGSATPPVQ